MAIQAQQMCWDGGFSLGADRMDINGGFNEFCSNLQQHYQQQTQVQFQQQQRNQSQQFIHNSILFPTSRHINTYSQPHTQVNANPHQHCSSSVASQTENQKQELDRFITLQNERLRLALQQQSRQQLSVLLSKLESKTLPLLKQKDYEIAQAANRALELQNVLRKLEMENQTWKRIAKDNETVIQNLNNAMEELKGKAGGLLSNGAEDAESCCDEGGDKTMEHGGDEEQSSNLMMKSKMVCRVCHSRRSCIMFLPCRHLCSCKPCETFLDSCPVCTTVKKASIEVIIF